MLRFARQALHRTTGCCSSISEYRPGLSPLDTKHLAGLIRRHLTAFVPKDGGAEQRKVADGDGQSFDLDALQSISIAELSRVCRESGNEERQSPGTTLKLQIREGTSRSENASPFKLSYYEFPQEVRSKLRIRAAASINIGVGRMEVMKVKILTEEGSPGGVSACQVGDEVQITDSRALGRDEGTQGAQTTAQIEVEIPERYCDVDLECRGGDVELAAVNEANLRVVTHGRRLTVGKAKVAVAHLDTHGGPVQVKQLVGQSIFVSAGATDIRQLLGREVSIKQCLAAGQCQKFSIGAAYVQESCTLDSGNADMEIGTLSSHPGVAQLISAGRVAVDSLDGRASISSRLSRGCSSAAVHGQDNLRMLDVTASGNVDLLLSPKLAENLRCSFVPQSIQPALPPGVQLCPLDEFERMQAEVPNDAEGPAPSAACVRLVGQGRVQLGVESWIEALNRRRKAEKV